MCLFPLADHLLSIRRSRIGSDAKNEELAPAGRTPDWRATGRNGQGPNGQDHREIWFYVQYGPNDVRKAYVMYYHPSRSGAPGCLYLAGHGDAWQYINWGSIMRGDRDGRWNYAALEWEALIKPIIARAEAEQAECLQALQAHPS